MPEPIVVQHTEVASHSQSFIVRVWLEDLGNGKAEWRGKVQSVTGAEVFYFRDWQTMIRQFQEILASQRPDVPDVKRLK